MRRLMLPALLSLWLLIACGGAAGDVSAPPVGEGVSEPQLQPIEREAECAFPATMQVGRPATVRFSIFTPGNEPNPLPDANREIDPLTLEARPDLELWVAVALEVSGAQITESPTRDFQRLSERSNIWIWQLTPQERRPVTIQPIIDVEYRDSSGHVVERRTNVWTQTYTVSEVIGRNYLNVASAWLSNGVQELITGFIGAALLRVGTGARRLIGRGVGNLRG